MSEPQAGDNLIKSIVSRIESVETDIKDRMDDRKEIYLEAKSSGFDTKALRAVIARRKADAAKLAEHEAIVETYSRALG